MLTDDCCQERLLCSGTMLDWCLNVASFKSVRAYQNPAAAQQHSSWTGFSITFSHYSKEQVQQQLFFLSQNNNIRSVS